MQSDIMKKMLDLRGGIGTRMVVEVDIKPFQERVKALQDEVIKMSDTTKNIFEEVRKLSN